LACALGILAAAAPVRGADPDVARGKSTYAELCAKCHGSSGKGDGKEAATLATKPKDLTDCARMSAFTEDQLFRIIKDGGPAGGLSKDMPPYGDALDDAEIRDTLAYIRGLCPK
jgi:mono/diheme cytochrome c family protein